MVEKGSIVLSVNDKKYEDERNARFAGRVNNFLRDRPEEIPDYITFFDESTLGATQHGPEYIPFEPLMQDSERMPQLTGAQIDAFTRHSERLKAIGQGNYEPARLQPKKSGLSEIFYAIERQLADEKDN